MINPIEPGLGIPRRPRALVMDDDPVFRTLLSAMLKRDYIVETAADGADGYDHAVLAPPDIAVVDIQMPNWDGLRTIKAFREHAALCRIPLLVLTSDAIQETVVAAVIAGADEYLIKSSFTREELLQTLQALRDRQAQARPAHRTRRSDDGLHHTPGEARAPWLMDHSSDPDAVAQRTIADRLQETIDAWE